MLFPSTEFLFAFLPCLLLLYFVVFRWTRLGQNILLTVASIYFYAWGEPSFAQVMLVSILLNWAYALWVSKCRHIVWQSRLCLTLMVISNLSILAIYKYLAFTLENINLLFASNFVVPQILLPLGISFFTFQAISYVVDIYRGNGEAQKNPINVALYISFFPQLIAGPIVRYQTIANQIFNRRENWSDFSAGLSRFALGLGKKLILADSLALIVSAAFDYPNEISLTMAWLGAIAYTLQIYFDFSAYSDMAIGLGRMFGFKFLENFNYPNASRSITDFWRRWHISLGSWFRDYVYIPLGGNRLGVTRQFFNLLIVWFITGFWHGANYTFIIWGLMHFTFMWFEKLTGFEKRISFLYGILYSFIIVMLSRVIFRSVDISSAWGYFETMFFLNDCKLIDGYAIFFLRENLLLYLLAIAISFPLYPWFKRRFCQYSWYGITHALMIVVVFILALAFLLKGGHQPFIYSNF